MDSNKSSGNLSIHEENLSTCDDSLILALTMKKLTVLLLAFSFAAVACNEPTDEIEKTEEKDTTENQVVDLKDSVLNYTDDQKALMLFYTSTGCPGCGSWGSPTFETIAKQYPNDVIPLAVHIKYGDPMITDISEAIANNRSGQYYTPQIWVNNTNIMVLNIGRIDGTQSVEKAVNTITTSSSSEAEVKMGSAALMNKEETKMQIKAGIMNKGSLDQGAEYFLASYILEDKIIWKQASSTSDHEHNYVIRACTEGNFGEAVSFTDGKFESLHTLDLTDYWKKDELTVLTVLWKKVGNRYFYENATLIDASKQ